MKIKGMIFDMDGVIVDSALFHYKSWQFVFDKFKLKYTRDNFRKSFGRTSRAIMKDFFSKNKINLTETRLERLDKEKEKEFRRLIFGKIKPLPGAIKLIKDCKKHKLKLAIASSGPRENINTIIRSLKIKKFVDVIVSGKEVKFSKPHPTIFLYAAKKLFLSPKNLIVIEDAPSGVKAAKKGKMFCIAVTNTVSKKKLIGADLVLDSLERLSLTQIL